MNKLRTLPTEIPILPNILKPVLEIAEKISTKEICNDNGNFDQKLTDDVKSMNQLTGGIFKGIISGIIVGIIVGLVLFKVVK